MKVRAGVDRLNRNEIFMQKLGSIGTFVMRSRNIKITELAKVCGSNQAYIGKILNGEVKNPSPEILFKLIKHLDLVFYME